MAMLAGKKHIPIALIWLPAALDLDCALVNLVASYFWAGEGK